MSEWISVEDRLPDDPIDVLVWNVEESVWRNGAVVATYYITADAGGYWQTKEEAEYISPTHWMPLPNPPDQEKP